METVFTKIIRGEIPSVKVYEGDGVGLVWPRKDSGLDALREYARRIKLD